MYRYDPRTRIAVNYGLALATGAFLLQWLEAQILPPHYALEIYIVLLCSLFTAVGIWIGHRLSLKIEAPQADFSGVSATNLGISAREAEVLRLLARGYSNQEIADGLFISTNTVKSHLQKLYSKLDVPHRGRAVEKARSLRLVP